MAIDDLLDEHEQSERVLAWLRANGAGLIGGIGLGLAAIFGWKWWDQQQLQQAHATADRYQAAVDAIKSGDAGAAQQVAGLEGVFAQLAALELAAAQVNEGQSDEAIATLRGIQASDPAMVEIINQRLARLLVDTGKPDEAIALLGTPTSAAALEALGDAQFAKGEQDQARQSYTKAIAALDPASPSRNLLTLKLMQVGGTPVAAAPQP